MIPKPSSCQGCPFYSDGQGFVPDELVEGATTMVLGQNPGSVEEAQGKPFIGPTGQTQTEHFFPLARLERGKNVHIANVLKCRWIEHGHKTDKLPTGEILEHAIEHCTREHLRIPDGTRLIIAEGAHSAGWCANTHVSIYKWRGHVLWPTQPRLSSTTVYVVEHLASVNRDPRMWWVAELDWRKIPRIQQGWPQVIPSRLIGKPENWTQVLDWFKQAARSAPQVALDTEFIGRPFGPNQPLLTIIGLGYRDRGGRVHGLQLDCREAENWMRASFYQQLGELVRVCPILLQNFAADMPVLKRCAGISYEAYTRVDDTMLAHAILYCELHHDLEFLTSIYGLYSKMKHLGDEAIPSDRKWESLQWLLEYNKIEGVHGDTPDLLYNWGDVLETISVGEHLHKAMEMDTQSKGVYENQSLKLIPILLKSMERGLRVNTPRVMRAKIEYEGRCQEAQVLAEAFTGKPINLGSDDQIKYYAYCERGYPVQYKRGKDKKSSTPTVDEDAVAVLRDFVGPVVDSRVPLTLDLALHRIHEGADPVLEARVLYQEAQHALDSYIYGIVRSVYLELNENRKKRAREYVKKHGFTEADLMDRLYPNFAIHAQKTGRWSTTNPPLAQLPGDLRDIIIPDIGECWLHWDWKGIELHFLELHSRSRILQRAHRDGIDLHTWTLCKMFGYDLPPNLKDPYGDSTNAAWRQRYSLFSSGDPRRVFAKSARYEMIYGGGGNNAAEKAVRMGLNKADVKRALANLLTADVDYYKWRQNLERQVKASRVVRTFMGRPRRFLTVSKDHSTAVPPKVVREALDYPMQGGVSDVFNTTIIKIHEQHPDLTWAWGMHDAQYWGVPTESVTDELVHSVQDIATTEYHVDGQAKRFPIDWDIVYPPKEEHHDVHTVLQQATEVEGKVSRST